MTSMYFGWIRTNSFSWNTPEASPVHVSPEGDDMAAELRHVVCVHITFHKYSATSPFQLIAFSAKLRLRIFRLTTTRDQTEEAWNCCFLVPVCYCLLETLAWIAFCGVSSVVSLSLQEFSSSVKSIPSCLRKRFTKDCHSGVLRTLFLVVSRFGF